MAKHKSLFSLYPQNEDRSALEQKIGQALRPIFEEWEAKGYPPHEIAYAAFMEINLISCERRLRAQIDARRHVERVARRTVEAIEREHNG